jgi:hypothetical protein
MAGLAAIIDPRATRGRGPMALVFVRVWEYEVPTAQVSAFMAAYGPDGGWSRLFGTAEGYLGTSLYRSTDASGRFLTVDRWRGEASWRAFLARFRPAYEALDAELAHLANGGHVLLEGSG